MERARRAFSPIAVLLVGITLAGCAASGGGPAPTATCEQLTDEGWALFEAGDYLGAAAKFQQAITTASGCTEAYHGRAWLWLKADSLARAVDDFDYALDQGLAGAAPFAGRASALLDLGDPPDYAAAAASAESALVREPAFVFAHDHAFNAQDLHLILAQCRFGLSDYVGANAEVDSLEGNVQDPGSPTFVEDLMAEIQRLGELLAGS